jgi:hypothetical protein
MIRWVCGQRLSAVMIADVGGSGGDFDVDQIAVALNYSF